MTIDEFIQARLWEDERTALSSASTRALREVDSKRHLLAIARTQGDGTLGESIRRCLAHTWNGHSDFKWEWQL
ncbi:hypothetical protein [Nocardia sp. NPDC050710]|uniref:hypothetical protein n=1 Tax=Nocardia sp. NPDC050710 TaxID=3157220 RepID=UPI0033CBE2D0